MKLALIFITFLYKQASGSYFDEIRGAMSDVERGFGKLLNDVVVDVKDTLHCTISAVEQVLAMNGLLDERSDYNSRCGSLPRAYIPNVPDHRNRILFNERLQITPPSLPSPEYSLEHISQELESSIITVDKSINDILGRRQAKSNLNAMSEIFQDETARLNTVSELLRRELDNISANVRNEIAKQGMNYKRAPQDTIWDDLNVLHDLKRNSNNETEINEIDHIIDRVVDELHVTPSQKGLSEAEKLEEIRKQLNKYSDGNSNNVNDQSSIWNTKDMTSHNTGKEINTFKDLVQSSRNEDNTQIGNIEKVLNQETTNHNTDLDKSLFDMYMASDKSSPFYNPNTNTDTKEIADDAKKILQESIESEKLINNFFNEKQTPGIDMFSNANMFNFG